MSKIETQINNMLSDNNKISNAQGIRLAYDNNNKIFVRNNKMYIAGTTNFNNWLENLTKLPFGVLGGIRDMERYIHAEDILKNNPEIDTVIGHSQGGAVALQLAKDYSDRNLKTRTYNAPVFSMGFNPNTEQHMRFRKVGDPVSAFDGGAVKVYTDTLNPLKNHDIRAFDGIDESLPEGEG